MKKSKLLKQNELRDNVKKQVLAECIEFCEDRGIDNEKLKILTYKTLHEICMNYRDIDVKRDIYEFMKLRAAATKMDCSKVFSVDDMRWRVICDTEIRFRHDLAMDSRRTEALREYIEDVAFSIFPIREEAVVRM